MSRVTPAAPFRRSQLTFANAWVGARPEVAAMPSSPPVCTFEHVQDARGNPVGLPLPSWSPPPPPPRTALSGRFATVEPLNGEKHSAALFDANAADADGVMWTYVAYGPFSTLAEYRQWVGSEYVCNGETLFWALVDKGTDALGGVVSYSQIRPRVGVVEIADVVYAPRFQRTPAATESVYLLLSNAFELGYRRCEWKCDVLNKRSKNAATRLGFSYEGTFRNAMVYNGRNRDTAWFSILDEAWDAGLRDAFLSWLHPSNFGDDGQQSLSLGHFTSPFVRARPPLVS
jgi:RimJ/RimL family protein N-acetyltransferase